MACPAVTTGSHFLGAALAHIDCQAQTIGSYGFGALASPGSPVSLALTALLTIFVAIFGVRLLLGYPMEGRDLINDIVRVGIVLTLATSWPAWRIVGYDLLINGPSEIARSVGLAAQLPGANGSLADRLQHVDEALAALNGYGSGRLGVATGDWFQLGFARSAFLVGTLAPLALVRLTSGILLALAPLMAGLLLFGVTRGVFVGWARGLFMAFLAAVTITLILGAELALLEPWLEDALARRAAEIQTLDAPVEVLVVTLSFAVVSLGALAVVARIAFHWQGMLALPFAAARRHRIDEAALQTRPQLVAAQGDNESARAHQVAQSVSEGIMREERMTHRISAGKGPEPTSAATPGGRVADASELLGSSWRRGSRRVSFSSQRRDSTR